VKVTLEDRRSIAAIVFDRSAAKVFLAAARRVRDG
jgi:hypothetical protein